MSGLIFRNASRLYLLSPEKRVSLNNSHMKSTAINISPANWRAFYLNWSHRACGAAEVEKEIGRSSYSVFSPHNISPVYLYCPLKSSVSSRKCCSIDIYENSPQLQCRAWITLWWRPFRVVVFPCIGVIAAFSTINVISRDLFQVKPEHKYNHRNEICSDVHTILLNYTLNY